MTGITLRAGRLSDAAALATIHVESRTAAMPWLPVLQPLDDVVAYMAGTVLVHQQVWVAEANGEPVGFAAVGGDMLNHLYIAPEWQGRGVGGALLEAARSGRDRLELWVFQRNRRARTFYERRGFVLVKQTDGAGNQERTPDALYAWTAAGADWRVAD
ncbi:MAG TPA: GNAT family N-acetyltransferase [Actinomycetes bacterium]|nr:GNAT family N-acetyltransferase [Actinomycetes bacterium]